MTGRRAPVPIYVAAAGAAHREIRRAERATGSSAPAARRASSIPRRSCRRSWRGGPRPARARSDYARMIEVKVSFDTDKQRAMEDTRHWAVLALTPEEKVSVDRPDRDGAPRRRALGRARRQPLDRLDRSGRACRTDRRVCRSRLRPSGLSRAGPRSGAVHPPLCGACPASPASPLRRRRTKRAGAHDFTRGHRARGPAPDRRRATT